ncbi:MAG: hypothetical protein ACPG8W_18535 [Candidatus Promineifilaceae bacterium]
MTTNNSILRKLFMGSTMLVAMFALAGSILFFTDTASAARGDGDRTPPSAEQIQQRIDDGEITQEQADRMAERAAEREALQGVIDRDAIHQAMADELGITVDELEQAKEDGVTLEELAETNGTTVEAVKAAADAEKAAQVQEALDNGDITEEQAERLLNGGGRRGGPRGGGDGEGRPGRRGPGGGNGQRPAGDEA